MKNLFGSELRFYRLLKSCDKQTKSNRRKNKPLSKQFKSQWNILRKVFC